MNSSEAVYEHCLTLDEKGCHRSVCSAPVKHVIKYGEGKYIGLCEFHAEKKDPNLAEMIKESMRRKQE